MKLLNAAAAVATALAINNAFADLNSQLTSLQAQINQLQAQINARLMTGNVIGVDPSLSWQMMNNMSAVGKEMNLLQARQNALNTPITIGGYVQGDGIYQHTNSTGSNNAAEFNLAPLSSGATLQATTGKSGDNLFLSSVDLATTVAMGSWITGYIQTGAQNVGSANPSSNTLVIQDAYALAGNLAKNPVYAYVGKKDIDFGSFASVNMYYAPLTREFFEAQGNTLGLGIHADGFNGTFSLMNGGTDGNNSNMYTTDANFPNNYALNLKYARTFNAVNWDIGAGYLSGSRFLNTSNATNGAWDINSKLSIAGFDVLAEYVSTVSQSYGKMASLPALSTSAQKVSIWDLGTDYNFPVLGIPSAVNLDYSQADLASGSNNTLKQIVVGYRVEPVNNVWTGVEYAYNKNGINAETGALYGSSYMSNTVLWDVTAAF